MSRYRFSYEPLNLINHTVTAPLIYTIILLILGINFLRMRVIDLLFVISIDTAMPWVIILGIAKYLRLCKFKSHLLKYLYPETGNKLQSITKMSFPYVKCEFNTKHKRCFMIDGSYLQLF